MKGDFADIPYTPASLASLLLIGILMSGTLISACDSGAPSKEVLRSAIVASIEEGELPEAILGLRMVSCDDASVSDLTIRNVGQAQTTGENSYWPVKIRTSGSCQESGSSCGGIFGPCETLAFEREEAEFRVWKDSYGDWQAEVMQ